ncbi:hypothetical protein EV187_0400 [Agromyces ramosus]|uniref:Uncharacterized protein n=1 Tax=Agromyces ramosus TaxID=33879 RepID=A0A4Q7MKM5_9MICO|nr:hypothetical protein EV187_0400 [Agromyces ramosus]
MAARSREGNHVDPVDQPGGVSSRSSVRGPVIVGAAALAIGLGLLGHQLVSTTAYEQAWSRLTSVETQLADTIESYERTLDRSEVVAVRAEALQTVAGGDLVAPDEVDALRAETAELRAALEAAPPPTGPITGRFEEPSTFAPAWERYADLVGIADALPARDTAISRFDEATFVVREARQAVVDRTDAVFTSAYERAEAEIDANALASYRTVLGVRHLIDAGGVDGQSTSATGFTALAEAVTALRASHAEAEAARSEHPVRAEVEAFARSISQGVALDFGWAYEVAGVTSDGWYAGTAEFWPEDGGWGHITLSHSIEDSWGDENARAVVVHEVGHTQAIRPTCTPIFEGPEFHRDHETWATAWAIGMGYDLPGAGIEAYGRPTDAQIAAAAQCR